MIGKKLIGKKCIFRTLSAGVFYGELKEREGKEVIIKNARRMYYWKNKDDGITLSHIAISGIHEDSKIQAPVKRLWVEAIEIIPCTKKSIKTFEEKDYYAVS